MESQESSYLKIINECHVIADQINNKTKLMQSPSIPMEKNVSEKMTRTLLEAELTSLVGHLKEIANSIVV